MDALVGKHEYFLRYLANCSNKERKCLIQNASVEQINLLSGLFLNFVNDRFPDISQDDINSLRLYQAVIIRLTNRRIKRKDKQTLLTNRPKLLPTFL